MKKFFPNFFLCICCFSLFLMCQKGYALPQTQKPNDSIYLKILGIAQDGGYPQIGCIKACCNAIKQGKETRKNVVSLGLVSNNKYWHFLQLAALPNTYFLKPKLVALF